MILEFVIKLRKSFCSIFVIVLILAKIFPLVKKCHNKTVDIYCNSCYTELLLKYYYE